MQHFVRFRLAIGVHRADPYVRDDAVDMRIEKEREVLPSNACSNIENANGERCESPRPECGSTSAGIRKSSSASCTDWLMLNLGVDAAVTRCERRDGFYPNERAPADQGRQVEIATQVDGTRAARCGYLHSDFDTPDECPQRGLVLRVDHGGQIESVV